MLPREEKKTKVYDDVEADIRTLLIEDDRRRAENNTTFNPITGEGSVGERKRVLIEGFKVSSMHLPVEMLRVPLVSRLVKAGSVEKFLSELQGKDDAEEYIPSEENIDRLLRRFVRIRILHDFPFWAALLVYIKSKGGGEDTLFRLNRPQRRLVEKLEAMRKAGKPIRLILLKARQWGGSTCIQLYMAWLQLVHKTGLNSIIVGHLSASTAEVKDMFDRMITHYPLEMLYEIGEQYNEREPKMVGVVGHQHIQRIPQRNCKIKLGTAESPDSARGGDYNLAHLTEVGLWKKTEGKTPSQIVKSATSGIVLQPYTMIVYESTANGTGNFFHREYEDAKAGRSQFAHLFIAWYEIEQYSLPFGSEAERISFATNLWRMRESRAEESTRSESGRYLYYLWEQGATLEAIHWYVLERAKYTDHGDMASEYPSDDVEAFVHSGARVFDRYKVEELRKTCRKPSFVGELSAFGTEGKDALRYLHFVDDAQGSLWIWEKPETYEDEVVRHRYLVVVDIGGRSSKADWSVITVFDRLEVMDSGRPVIVAQWYGHIDHDLLAWKSAQIASYYDNALLVIESNTLETRDKERQVDGDQSLFILNQIKEVYDNLYARRQSAEEIAESAPRKWGFHTNVSTKPMIITTLIKVIRERLYVERDERCLDEYLCYERRQNGSYGAISGKHDDLLMTRAIGLHISIYEMPPPVIIQLEKRQPKKRKPISMATI